MASSYQPFFVPITARAGDYLTDATLPSAADYKLRGLLGDESLEKDESYPSRGKRTPRGRREG